MNEKQLSRRVAITLANRSQKQIINKAMIFYTDVIYGNFESITGAIVEAYPKKLALGSVSGPEWVAVQQSMSILRQIYFGDDPYKRLNSSKPCARMHNLKEDVVFSKKLTVECTAGEVLMIRDCLNLYGRVLMGQMKEIDWTMRSFFWDRIRNYDHRIAEMVMQIAKTILFNMNPNCSYGIGQRECSLLSRKAYEIQRWMEYDIFKDDPEIQKGHSVLKYGPIRVTKQPRIKLEFVQ